MAITLDDKDKLIIIIIASILILVTLFATICIVCPCCFIHRLILKSKQKKNLSSLKTTNFLKLSLNNNNQMNNQIITATSNNLESQYFHYSIVPIYGKKAFNVQQPQQQQSESSPLAPIQSSSLSTSKDKLKLMNNLSNPILQNQYENLTNLAKLRYKLNCQQHQQQQHPNYIDNYGASCNNGTTSTNHTKLPKLEMILYYKSVENGNNNNNNKSNNIRLYLFIKRIYDLSLNELSLEPSPYIVVILTGNNYRLQCKNFIINKDKSVLENEIFRTEIIKRTLDHRFDSNQQFISEIFTKNMLKDMQLKLRLMYSERYANDVCVGELNISLKKCPSYEEMLSNQSKLCANNILNEKSDDHNDRQTDDNNNKINDCNNDIESNQQIQSTVYQMFPIKEVKGEIMVGLCYLPTSKRVNITIIKGSIRNSILRFIEQTTTQTSNNQLVYYIKALLFQNGRLIRKKKTSSSLRLLWGKDETISFDLPREESTNINEQLSLMLILSYRIQNSNSPESPDNNNGGGFSSPEYLNSPPSIMATKTMTTATNMNDKNFNSNEQAMLDSDKNNNNLNNDDCNNNINNNDNNQNIDNNNNNISSKDNNNNHTKAFKNNSNNLSKNNLRKGSCIGHFILDRPTWNELLRKPRKQIIKWYKLY